MDSGEQAKTNDALQGGEDNPAYGEDARDFGVGGQTVQRPLDGDDAADRETGRDPTVPRDEIKSDGRS